MLSVYDHIRVLLEDMIAETHRTFGVLYATPPHPAAAREDAVAAQDAAVVRLSAFCKHVSDLNLFAGVELCDLEAEIRRGPWEIGLSRWTELVADAHDQVAALNRRRNEIIRAIRLIKRAGYRPRDFYLDTPHRCRLNAVCDPFAYPQPAPRRRRSRRPATSSARGHLYLVPSPQS
jgi:hypothetical protein